MRDWTIRGPVSLHDYVSGEITTFDSAKAFVTSRTGQNIRGSFGDSTVFNNVGNPDKDWFGILYRYLLLDENELIIPMWKIEELYIQYPVPFRSWRRKVPYKFRCDPVPGIRGRWSCGSWYKRPRTLQEMRAAVALEHDEDTREYHIKPRRSRPNVPNSYWDMQRSDVRNCKSWKSVRKTQWKSV